MSDDRLQLLEQRTDARLSGVETVVNDLRTEVRVSNERQEQRHQSMTNAVERLCGKIKEHDEEDDRRFAKIESRCDDLHKELHVDDGEDDPSLNTRVGRVEGHVRRTKWWATAVISAFLSVLGGIVVWITQMLGSRGNQ